MYMYVKVFSIQKHIHSIIIISIADNYCPKLTFSLKEMSKVVNEERQALDLMNKFNVYFVYTAPCFQTSIKAQTCDVLVCYYIRPKLYPQRRDEHLKISQKYPPLWLATGRGRGGCVLMILQAMPSGTNVPGRAI